tara:strand:+ start:1349 stop:2542 length:1194 start_codon:yes stop_codon:yes gene_type:complete
MSDVQDDVWVDNPFTFGKKYPLPTIKPLPMELRNPLKDFFANLKAKYIKMPPAKIRPVEPVATTQWTPEMGMGDTLVDRFAPNPAFIGLPLKRKEIETTRGTKGWNTHYNIMVDQSGSMQANSTEFEGVQLDRSMVCRLASCCLIQQASLNLDSFTVFTYNDVGKLAWPLPDGEPSFDYAGCLEYLTAESVNRIWNGTNTSQGEINHSYTREAGDNYLLNALAAMVPDGENNEDSAFEVMIRNVKKHDIKGMITVFITDGDNLAGPVTNGSRSGDTGGLTYDQWMRQFGHVFYIVLRSPSETRTIQQNMDKTARNLADIYGWDKSLADKFVWGFPDPTGRCRDEDGNLITNVADQMGWLFAEIGRIFAGTSEEFDDLAEELGEIGADGDYKSPVVED